jgi:hypothetical protein
MLVIKLCKHLIQVRSKCQVASTRPSGSLTKIAEQVYGSAVTFQAIDFCGSDELPEVFTCFFCGMFNFTHTMRQ